MEIIKSQFHECYAYAVYNLNKRLAVEKMWPMYCYDQTKLNYKMYALEF